MSDYQSIGGPAEEPSSHNRTYKYNLTYSVALKVMKDYLEQRLADQSGESQEGNTLHAAAEDAMEESRKRVYEKIHRRLAVASLAARAPGLRTIADGLESSFTRGEGEDEYSFSVQVTGSWEVDLGVGEIETAHRWRRKGMEERLAANMEENRKEIETYVADSTQGLDLSDLSVSEASAHPEVTLTMEFE